MTRYEVTTILADETAANPASALVTENGGKILNEEALGKRRFAYPINKLTSGAYHRVRFEAEPAAIAPIEAALHHDNSVIRHLIVTQPHEPQPQAVAEVDDAAIEALGDVKEMTKKAEQAEAEKAAPVAEPVVEEAVEEAATEPEATEEVTEEPAVEETEVTEEPTEAEKSAAAGSEETEEVVDEAARQGALDKKLDEILGK